MSKTLNKAFLAGFISLAIFLLLSQRNCVKTHENKNVERFITIVKYETPSRDWEAFVNALVYVESKGDSLAVGTKNDVGILQLRPIYVDEVNRILGDSVYSYDDRYNVKKSLEMFDVMQNHYNKEKCLHYALKIHNPYAPLSYHRKVMKYYNEFKEKEK